MTTRAGHGIFDPSWTRETGNLQYTCFNSQKKFLTAMGLVLFYRNVIRISQRLKACCFSTGPVVGMFGCRAMAFGNQTGQNSTNPRQITKRLPCKTGSSNSPASRVSREPTFLPMCRFTSAQDSQLQKKLLDQQGAAPPAGLSQTQWIIPSESRLYIKNPAAFIVQWTFQK